MIMFEMMYNLDIFFYQPIFYTIQILISIKVFFFLQPSLIQRCMKIQLEIDFSLKVSVKCIPADVSSADKSLLAMIMCELIFKRITDFGKIQILEELLLTQTLVGHYLFQISFSR